MSKISRAIILIAMLGLLVSGCILTSNTVTPDKASENVATPTITNERGNTENDILNSKELIVALIGLIVGLFLSVINNAVGRRWTDLRIKAALISELRQLRTECDRLVGATARDVQLAALNSSEPSSTTEVVAPIYLNFYKDVVLNLSVSQRISYQMIHSLISSLNRSFSEETTLIHQIQDAHASGNQDALKLLIGKRGDMAHGTYGTIRIVQWHIDFHLENQRNPELTIGTDLHRSYLQFLEVVQAELDDIKSSVNGLSPESFAKRYDPESFDAFSKNR